LDLVMGTREPGAATGADEPLDGGDLAILAGIRDAFTGVDPMPADLVKRILFALALEDADVEVCRLREELGMPVGVRGDEASRTVTFDSDSLTVMVTIGGDGEAVRLDGWIAPAGHWAVEVRTGDGPVAAIADGMGRFVVDGLPHGLAQLVVRSRPGEVRIRPVVTPSIVI
jgi:hypothetical protein